VEELIQWFVADGHGYPLIFLALLASGIGVPIPEDVPLIAAGVLGAHGGLDVISASMACGAFVLMRDSFVFALGYRYGLELLENRWASRVIKADVVRRFQARILKNDKAVVFSGRFMPGFRGPVFFAAGTARVHPVKFLVIDALAAVISVPVWVWLGYIFADHFDTLVEAAKQFRVGLLTVTGLFVVLIARRLWKNRLRSDPAARE
jgi:membrane protein DedA with SNARE-associated domain